MLSHPSRVGVVAALLTLGSGLSVATAPDPLPPVGGAGAAGLAAPLLEPAAGLVAQSASAATAPAVPTEAQIQADYGKLPYTFEANGGQVDAAVKFLARGPGYSLFLTPGEAVLSLHTKQPQTAPRPGARQEPISGPTPAAVPEPTAAATPPAVLRLSLVGANPEPVIRGEEALPGKVNYLTGKDPAAWRTGLSTYAKVRYEGVYPGVDLVYYGTQGQLEYDLVLAPGADPTVIRLAFEGADQITLDDTGNLVLTLGEQQVIQHSPRVYQERNGERTPIPTRYVLADNRQVSLAIGDYDAERALVIDPVLVYSTYLGGSGQDWGNHIAVDVAGNAYLTGRGSVGSVAKLSADGATLVYTTFVSFGDELSIAVDAAGNAFLTGYTNDDDVPTRNAFQPDYGGGGDAFVAKLSADGATLVYASYLGGSGQEGIQGGVGGIAVDGAGNAYVTGATESTDFPTHNALQPNYCSGDAFVAKISADGATLVYSTCLGGSGYDQGNGIAVDAAGNAYLTGDTSSTDFPTRNAFQPYFGGDNDVFVAKLSADGTTLVYASYLGGRWEEYGTDIAVDNSGNAYLTGWTRNVEDLPSSEDFPTRNALQPDRLGLEDGFVAKISADGTALLYSTYLGGRFTDSGTGIAVDAAGNAYVTGETYSSDFPTHRALQPTPRTYPKAFVVELGADGTTLIFGSLLGGSSGERRPDIALDGAGNAYMTGLTWSTDFPTRNALQPDFGGWYDAFVLKIADVPIEAPTALPWLASLGDATGGGSQHLAVLFEDTAAGTLTARIKDAVAGTLLRTLEFDAEYRPLDLAVLPDQNANGGPELALLGLRATDNRVQVEVRDSLTGDRLSAVAFNPAFAPKRLAVLPDRNGNGAAELAVLGTKASTGAIAAEIKDAASGIRLGQVFFAKAYRPVDFAAVADADGNGAAELAVLGVDAAGQPRVELRDSASTGPVQILWAPKWTTPLSLTEVPDINGNGHPEVAVLGRGTRTLLVKTGDAGSGDPLSFVFYNPTFTPHQVAAVPDLDGNGVAELAVLGRNAAGQLKTELRDALTEALVGNLWFDRLDPLDLTLLSDLNGNGSPEVAVLGVPSIGGAQVLIRDTLTGELIGRLNF